MNFFTHPSEPPKFLDTSTIEVEEKPEEPLEWYLLGLRYPPVPTSTCTYLPVISPTYLVPLLRLRGNTSLVHMRNADFLLFLR